MPKMGAKEEWGQSLSRRERTGLKMIKGMESMSCEERLMDGARDEEAAGEEHSRQ